MATVSKKENRGGARPGSGPKPQTLSARQVDAMLKKAERWAKEKGKDIDDILLGFIYDSSATLRDRTACIKLWKEQTAPKIHEGGETDRALGPSVFLPEQHPRLELVKGGKKEKDGDEGKGD